MELLLDVQEFELALPVAGGGRGRVCAAGANLQMAARQIVGVLGESGSGKKHAGCRRCGVCRVNGLIDAGRGCFAGTNYLDFWKTRRIGAGRGSKVS